MQAILNPPGNPKAKYFKHKKDSTPKDVDKWLNGAEEHAGSWWPYWMEWLQERSGKKVAAPKATGSKENPALEAAPGTYVFD